MFKRLKETSTRIARPRTETLHGIQILKQPVGRYFEVLDRTGSLLMDLLEAAFPGQTPGEILDGLTRIDSAQLRSLAIRLMGQLPRTLVALLGDIVGARENPAWEQLTPAEMLAVVKRFWEANDLSDFFGNARSMLQRMLLQQATPPDSGFNG